MSSHFYKDDNLKDGPFANHGRKYFESGYSVMPVRGKSPVLRDWSRFCKSLPTDQEFAGWEVSHGDFNIGMACGPASNTVAVDIDTDDQNILDRIHSVLPPSPVGKRGKKGATFFYRYTGNSSQKFKLHSSGKPIVELLSVGCQTVLPPSIHPETKLPYLFHTGECLTDVRPDALPDLRPDLMSLLNTAFSGMKVEPEGVDSGGRNASLKSQAAAAISKGKRDEEIAEELLRFDQRFHSNPLFSDPNEAQMKGQSAEQNAMRFVQSIRRSMGIPNPELKEAPPIDSRLFMSPWPKPLSEEAFVGLAGKIVKTIAPETESDVTALLLQFLVVFGNVVGRNAFFPVEADRHYLNLFVVIVGDSSKGRKGTSWGHVLSIFETVDPDWKKNCLKSGLSSGEGLTWAVRDPIERAKALEDGNFEMELVDRGIEDKRLCDVETEFSNVLKNFERDGNKLSAVIRNAWDRGDLQSLTKNEAAKATGAHISIIGHITKPELLRYLSQTETANGFGNRFLWICAKRSKLLPEGGRLTVTDLQSFLPGLKEAIEFGRNMEELRFDHLARETWRKLYYMLAEEKPGLFGAMTARAEAQILRLSSIYAVLDCSFEVQEIHLLAGVAVWQYCESSCRYIFGDATGDKIADRILEELKVETDGLTQTEISTKIFSKHMSSLKIHQALDLLKKYGFAHQVIELGGDGRKRHRWLLTKARFPRSEDASPATESSPNSHSASSPGDV